MSRASDNERCMFFVGGNKAKSLNPIGQTYAGGCTKEWWDDQPNIDTVAGKQTAMGKLMGSDGEPIIDCSTTTYLPYSFEGGDVGEAAKVTDVVGTAFANAEVGMLAFYHGSNMFTATGCYKIVEVGGSGAGNTYIVLKAHWTYTGDPPYLDGEKVSIGGAWSDIKELFDYYIDAFNYSQEVWINKDLTPTDQWDWSDCSGDVYNNTWLKVIGFHRVPGDITEPGGAYFQTAKDMYDNGVHADKLVDVDMSGLSGDLIAGDNSFNITMRGFHFNNAPVTNGMFELSVGAWGNIDLEHNAFEISVRMDLAKCRNFLLSDSLIAPSAVYVDSLMNTDATSVVILLNNYITHDALTVGMNLAEGAIYFGMGNIINVEGATAGIVANLGSLAISLNNTYVGFDVANGNGQLRVNNEGSLVSINDIILNKIASAYALEVAKYGGSFITKNLCAYSEAGQLGEVMELHPDEATGNIQKHDIDNLLEVDPLLDGDYEPLEQQVRTGGTPDVLGDPTSIGAIKTMNTTVINTAVQDALSSGGVKLAADGLDDVVVAEPSGDPSGWSFAQGLKWLIMRFKNKHTSDNFSGIVVHKADGEVSTSQAVTEVDGVKAVGKVQ